MADSAKLAVATIGLTDSSIGVADVGALTPGQDVDRDDQAVGRGATMVASVTASWAALTAAWCRRRPAAWSAVTVALAAGAVLSWYWSSAALRLSDALDTC